MNLHLDPSIQVKVEPHGSDSVEKEPHGSDSVEKEPHGSDSVEKEPHGSAPQGKRKRASQVVLEDKKKLVLTVLKECGKTMDDIMQDARVQSYVEKAYGDTSKTAVKKARHVLSAFLNNKLDERIVLREGKYERGVDHDTRPHMSEKTIVHVSFGETTLYLTYKEAQGFIQKVNTVSAPATPASALHAALRQNNGRGPLSNVVYGYTVSALQTLPEGAALTSSVDALIRFGLAASL